MADPVTWGVLISAAGMGYQAYTGKQTADYNAEMANREADYQEKVGASESEDALKRMRINLAKGKVSAVKSGTSLLGSSNQSVFEDITEEGTFDALMIKSNADNAAMGSRSKAQAYKAEGNAAVVSGAIGVGSSVLTNYKKMKFK